MVDFQGGHKDSGHFLTALPMGNSQRNNYGGHLRNDMCRKNGAKNLSKRIGQNMGQH